MGILIVFAVGFGAGFVSCLYRREIQKRFRQVRIDLTDQFR